MYYSTQLLTRKGPLSKMWLAGTMIKKMSKQAIVSSDLVRPFSTRSSAVFHAHFKLKNAHIPLLLASFPLGFHPFITVFPPHHHLQLSQFFFFR